MNPLLLLALLATSATTPDAQAIAAADLRCSEASAAKGLEGYLSCFADDAISVVKDGPPLAGKDAIREALRKTFVPGSTLTWSPIRAEAAASGDLGYSVGAYELKATKDGKPVSYTGKYTSIWKKQKDGTWKIAVDMGD